MVMSYTILTGAKTEEGSIKSWMNYGKVDSGGVLEEAQTMIYERLRVREMRSAETLSIRVGADAEDLPDGFLAHRMLKDITNDCRIGFKDERDLESMRTWTDGALDEGDPAFFGIFDEQLQFDVKTRTAWTGRLLFYKQPDFLSTSNKTNFLTKRYPHLLRMGCLATGARFNRDDESYAREQKLLFASIDRIATEDEMANASEMGVE